MGNQKVVIGIIALIILAFGAATFAAYYAVHQTAQYSIIKPVEPSPVVPSPTPAPNPTPSPTPSPSPAPIKEQVTLREGERNGPLLVQNIYADYITGLNFREYPVATNQGQPITLRIGEIASNGCTVTLTLISIQGDTATFREKIDNDRPCPICLAENTLIDTLAGQIPVQDLREGMAVWTVDKSGNKTSATIIKTSKTPVPATHQMVHVALADGREIFASPRHPIGDGRVFNDLSAGSILSGSKVVIAEKITYDKHYTYDILPKSPTGFYFANGILIGSTLKNR